MNKNYFSFKITQINLKIFSMKKYLISYLFIFFIFSGFSQVVYEQGEPVGLNSKLALQNVPVVSLPYFDIKAEEEANLLKDCKTLPIGKVFRNDLDFMDNASVVEVNNERIWYLRIKSPVGKAISFNFEDFRIPEGAKLFIYSADGKFVFGPITYRNNKPSGFLPTRYIPSTDVIVEYHVPVGKEYNADFIIKDIVVYYKLLGSSQACEVNINCPEGAEWQTEKHSVAKIIFTSGLSQYLCTGALVGNTAKTRTPYFLTANHCINNQNSAQSAVFYFNYESTDCDGLNITQDQTLSGSTLIATGETSSGTTHLDFTLLKLSVVPPLTYQPYYAGWSRISDPAAIDSSVCIHHPSGDIKKISKDFDSPGVGTFTGYDANTHWQIFTWDLGTTEGGSSGSPLFNQNRHIIGDLSGGEADCDYNHNDYYAQFYQSWDKYTDTAMQLKKWLDPLGQNPVFINGYDPYANYVYLPPVSQLYAYQSGQDVKLHWLPPDYSGDSIIYDDFENYQSFALSIPNWTMKDIDQGVTWGIEGVQFDNENYIGAFILFNSQETDPPNATGWTAHSGNSMLVCFNAQPPYNPNNDWLISKNFECTASHKLVFYARSVTDKLPLERIRILVSENSSDINDFVPISSEPYEEVPAQWTRFEYDLSAFAGKRIYVAINVVSDNSFALLLDDISITTEPSEGMKIAGINDISIYNRETTYKAKSDLPKLAVPVLQSYSIYRNYAEVATVPKNQLYYSDAISFSLPVNYYVIANYDLGPSDPSNQVEVNAYSDSLSAYDRDNAVQILPNPVVDGNFTVQLNHPVEKGTLNLFNIYGQKILTVPMNNTKELHLSLPQLQPGVYIMQLEVLNEDYKTLFIVL